MLDRTASLPRRWRPAPRCGTHQHGDRRVHRQKLSRANGRIVHEIEGDAFPPEGATVHGAVDWDRRYKLMRTHTALHSCRGVVWRGLRGAGDGREHGAAYGAHGLRAGEHVSRLRPGGRADDQRRGRRRAARPPSPFTRAKRALTIPDLIRTKVNLIPESVQQIRTIDIEGLDLQADGGLHVNNTREVGTIRVVKHESKGRINKRLRIRVE